jgi:hypothetical protein
MTEDKNVELMMVLLGQSRKFSVSPTLACDIAEAKPS